jgi:hypothetical protein
VSLFLLALLKLIERRVLRWQEPAPGASATDTP